MDTLRVHACDQNCFPDGGGIGETHRASGRGAEPSFKRGRFTRENDMGRAGFACKESLPSAHRRKAESSSIDSLPPIHKQSQSLSSVLNAPCVSGTTQDVLSPAARLHSVVTDTEDENVQYRKSCYREPRHACSKKGVRFAVSPIRQVGKGYPRGVPVALRTN